MKSLVSNCLIPLHKTFFIKSFRLFAVPYFSVRSSRSSAVRCGWPSCTEGTGMGFYCPPPLRRFDAHPQTDLEHFKPSWPPITQTRSIWTILRRKRGLGLLTVYKLACEQALLFGRAKRVSREPRPLARAFSRGSLRSPKQESLLAGYLQIIFCIYFFVGEIVKQVNHIIRSKIGGVRSEYLATKEKKLEKRRSFKY